MLLEEYDKTVILHNPADYESIKAFIQWWRPNDERMFGYLEKVKEDIQGMLLRDVINNTLMGKKKKKAEVCREISKISGSNEAYVEQNLHKYFYDDDIKKENCLYIKELCKEAGIENYCVTNGDFFIQFDNIYNKKMKKGATTLTEDELKRRASFREFFYLAVETKSHDGNNKIFSELIKYLQDKYSTDVVVYGEADKSEYTQDILCQIEEKHPNVSYVIEAIADSKKSCIKRDRVYPIGNSKTNDYGLIIRFD